MIVKVIVRLDKPEGAVTTTGVLTNEGDEKGGCELLIDGVRYRGKYVVLNLVRQ